MFAHTFTSTGRQTRDSYLIFHETCSRPVLFYIRMEAGQQWW
jgi:hypothetical protein